MLTTKRINLKSRETKLFVENISLREISLKKDRKLAKDFKWYSWFYYKILIKIMFGITVDRSSLIETEKK